MFQRSVDYPDDQHPGYHVVLDDERVVTVRWDQVKGYGGLYSGRFKGTIIHATFYGSGEFNLSHQK